VTLFGFKLDGDFDHINGLDDTSGEHAAEATNEEGLDRVEELVSG